MRLHIKEHYVIEVSDEDILDMVDNGLDPNNDDHVYEAIWTDQVMPDQHYEYTDFEVERYGDE